MATRAELSIILDGSFVPESVSKTMEIHSPAFSAAAPIPAKFTCDGENISVPLEWHNVPAAAQSLALICADPDASNGDWVHWVVYNIPPHLNALPENIDRQALVQITGTSITQGYGLPPGTDFTVQLQAALKRDGMRVDVAPFLKNWSERAAVYQQQVKKYWLYP